jgi:hypothetical protein
LIRVQKFPIRESWRGKQEEEKFDDKEREKKS